MVQYVQIGRVQVVGHYLMINLDGTHIAIVSAGGGPKSMAITSPRITRLAGLDNADIAAGGTRFIGTY